MRASEFVEELKSNNWEGAKLKSGLIVDSSLCFRGSQLKSLPDNLTIGGALHLRDVPITSLPNNLSIGAYLYLQETQIKSLPDNLTVGGFLYLQGTQLKSLPDNLTVGGSLDLRGTQHTYSERMKVKRLKQGDRNEKWIYADNILTHIKTIKKMNGITLYISPYRTLVVTKDHKTFAHGEDVRSAIQDLNFKTMQKNVEYYRNLTTDTELNFDEAIIMYRVITGSCQYGVQRFLDEHPELKDMKTITIQEILDITNGSYGSETFREFFNQ